MTQGLVETPLGATGEGGVPGLAPPAPGREIVVHLSPPVLRKRAKRSERSARAGVGGYQENGHASLVVDNIGCIISSVILAVLNTSKTKTMVYVTI